MRGSVCAMGYTTASTRHVNAVLTSVARVKSMQCRTASANRESRSIRGSWSIRVHVQRAGIRATTHKGRHTCQDQLDYFMHAIMSCNMSWGTSIRGVNGAAYLSVRSS